MNDQVKAKITTKSAIAVLSFLGGIGVALITASIAFADVRRDAAIGAAILPRIEAAEVWQAGDEEWKKAVKQQLDRIEAKLGR